MSEEESKHVAFVSLKSKGGPHDDESFYAGVEMGLLESQLRQLSGMVTVEIHAMFHIRKDNHKQADLLAMSYGFAARWRPCQEVDTHLEMIISPTATPFG
jgi:hypothetical protein